MDEMTKSKPKKCSGCGKKRKTVQHNKSDMCSQCMTVAELLIEDPELLIKISDIVSSPVSNTEDIENIDIPDVLDAVRYKTRDREMNTWYVSVSEQEGNPVEIFASTAFDRDHHLQSRISNLTTITRLVSLILRNVFLKEKLTLEKTLTQLHRSSRQPNDLPDMLTRVLRNYSKNSQLSDEESEWL